MCIKGTYSELEISNIKVSLKIFFYMLDIYKLKMNAPHQHTNVKYPVSFSMCLHIYFTFFLFFLLSSIPNSGIMTENFKNEYSNFVIIYFKIKINFYIIDIY